MKTFLHIFLLGLIVAMSMISVSPATAQDDYWVNHWNWYDNTYQPYYYRSYRPASASYYGPAYSPGYAAPGYYGPAYSSSTPYGYNAAPYRAYYGAPAAGYGRTYGGRQAVQVGPMSFGWR